MGSNKQGEMQKTVKVKIAKINNNNNNNAKKTKAPNPPKIKTVITTKTKVKETKTKETKVNIKNTPGSSKTTIKTTTKTGQSSGSTVKLPNISIPRIPTPTVAYAQFKALKWTKWTKMVFAFLILLFFMQIVCTSTTSWVAFGSTQSHGLFRVCKEESVGSGTTECSDYQHLADFQIQMQALMMVSIFMFLFCFVYLIFWMKGRNLPLIVLAVLVEITALLIVVSASIFTDKHFCAVGRSKLGTFGWSYYLAWATSLVAIVTGILVTKVS
ncbi:uncharacterized protein [Clytia hemisphaerica]|uniref:Uncharacterized protein n=1 Tax=Clytia hemisphaerica TaxID=252671 RepID=A0A7M5XHL6_9CNID|eukprot:TCONS_00055965-protein